MLHHTGIPFQADRCDLVIGPELKRRLADILETARLSLNSRDVAETCLVNEMAISKGEVSGASPQTPPPRFRKNSYRPTALPVYT